MLRLKAASHASITLLSDRLGATLLNAAKPIVVEPRQFTRSVRHWSPMTNMAKTGSSPNLELKLGKLILITPPPQTELARV